MHGKPTAAYALSVADHSFFCTPFETLLFNTTLSFLVRIAVCPFLVVRSELSHAPPLCMYGTWNPFVVRVTQPAGFNMSGNGKGTITC